MKNFSITAFVAGLVVVALLGSCQTDHLIDAAKIPETNTDPTSALDEVIKLLRLSTLGGEVPNPDSIE